jgi:hypothetical protein
MGYIGRLFLKKEKRKTKPREIRVMYLSAKECQGLLEATIKWDGIDSPSGP